MKYFKFFLLLKIIVLVFFIFISGCSNIAGVSEVPLEAIPGIKENYDYNVFDGQTVITDSYVLPEDLSVIIYETMLFSNENSECLRTFRVQSDLDAERDYNEACPPMPLLVYPLGVYQVAHNSYMLQFKVTEDNDEVDELAYFTFEPNQWYKLVILFDNENKNISVSINDELSYITIDDVEINMNKFGNVKLGQGWLERFWKGKMAYFRVYDGNGKIYYVYK